MNITLEGILAIIAISVTLINAVFTGVNAMLARKSQDRKDSLAADIEEERVKSQKDDTLSKAAQALIEPLRNELARTRVELRKAIKKQDSLIEAVNEYLSDRQKKLKDAPQCQECLAADFALRQRLRLIVVNGDKE